MCECKSKCLVNIDFQFGQTQIVKDKTRKVVGPDWEGWEYDLECGIYDVGGGEPAKNFEQEMAESELQENNWQHSIVKEETLNLGR